MPQFKEDPYSRGYISGLYSLLVDVQDTILLSILEIDDFLMGRADGTGDRLNYEFFKPGDYINFGQFCLIPDWENFVKVMPIGTILAQTINQGSGRFFMDPYFQIKSSCYHLLLEGDNCWALLSSSGEAA